MDGARSRHVGEYGVYHYLIAGLRPGEDDKGVFTRHLAYCGSIVIDGQERADRDGSNCFQCSGGPEELAALHDGFDIDDEYVAGLMREARRDSEDARADASEDE